MRMVNGLLIFALMFTTTSASSAASPAAGDDLNRAFFNVVGGNDMASAKRLLARGADVNAPEPPWKLTPLLIAPDKSLEMVRFLLEHGADASAADREGTTVLMRAVHSGDPRIVAAVLKYHPRLEAKGTWNNTALTYAVVQGNPEMVRLLIAAGADVNAERADGMQSLDMARRRLDIAKALPRGYGIQAARMTANMDTSMHMDGAMMHDVPRSVLIDKSTQVLALLQRAHARHGSGKMASRDVMQHCGKMPQAM